MFVWWTRKFWHLHHTVVQPWIFKCYQNTKLATPLFWLHSCHSKEIYTKRISRVCCNSRHLSFVASFGWWSIEFWHFHIVVTQPLTFNCCQSVFAIVFFVKWPKQFWHFHLVANHLWIFPCCQYTKLTTPLMWLNSCRSIRNIHQMNQQLSL